MSTFWEFIDVLALSWSVISIVAYFAYKTTILDVPSWEESVKTICFAGITLLIEEFTGSQNADKIADQSIILSNSEVMLILKNLTNHPYDTPTLLSYRTDLKNVSHIEIEAIGLVSTYRDISNDSIAKMVQHIMQNYYLETRNLHVNVVVKVATAERLYLAIPLSRDAERFLSNQNTRIQTDIESIKTVEPLIEEIPDIFDDDSKKEDE